MAGEGGRRKVLCPEIAGDIFVPKLLALVDKFGRISLYVTDVAIIAKLYVTKI